MTLALFSDIHANLPALEACLADIDKRRPDQVFCLGDLVGYNIWPNEVVREIRRRGIPAIAGNYDFGIGRAIDDCGCAYKTEDEKANGAVSISYTNQTIEAAERSYLRGLPKHIRLDFEWQENAPLSLLMVHGSPRKINRLVAAGSFERGELSFFRLVRQILQSKSGIFGEKFNETSRKKGFPIAKGLHRNKSNEYLFEDREEKSLLRIMEGAGADILCFGHTHKPFHRILDGGTADSPRYRHAINIGSVGKPKDGDPRGCYAWIELDENSSLSKPDTIRVSFVRFEYDVEKSARAVEESILPDAYAAALRLGR